MNYKLPIPSLKRLCLIELGTYLLNRTLSNVRGAVVYLPSEFQRWSTLKEEISKTLQDFPLPSCVMKEVWDILMVLHLQALEWEDLIDVDCFQLYGIVSSHELSFTVHGKINGPKMLDFYMSKIVAAIDTPYFDMSYWFVIACSWCLESYVAKIWKEMSREDRDSVRSSECGNPVVAYWVSHVTGESNKLTHVLEDYGAGNTIFESMAQASASHHETRAFEYFWDKLTTAEKARNAADYGYFAVSHTLTDIMCSSLELMTHRESIKFLQRNAAGVVKCFLAYPYDEFFVASLEEAAPYLRVSDYTGIFVAIRKKMMRDVDITNDLAVLLREFWARCPPKAMDNIRHSVRKGCYFDSPEFQLIKDVIDV